MLRMFASFVIAALVAIATPAWASEPVSMETAQQLYLGNSYQIDLKIKAGPNLINMTVWAYVSSDGTVYARNSKDVENIGKVTFQPDGTVCVGDWTKDDRWKKSCNPLTPVSDNEYLHGENKLSFASGDAFGLAPK